MNLQQIPLISIVLFFPLVGAVILFFVKKENTELIKRFTLVWTILTFVLSLGFVIGFRYGDPGFQFSESLPWIPQLGIGYQVGLDGISLLLIILTTGLMTLAVLSSFKAVTDRLKEYYIFMLLLETGMLGVFFSLDLFLFYVRILGKLREIPTISNYCVTPIIGVIPWPYDFRLATQGVSRIFTIPLEWLANPSHYEIPERILPTAIAQSLKLQSLPVIYFTPYDGELLWGISAQIVLSLIEVIFNNN